MADEEQEQQEEPQEGPHSYAFPPIPTPVSAGDEEPIINQPQPTYGSQGHEGGQVVPTHPGLDYLSNVDKLFVQQRAELSEAFFDCASSRKFKVKNDQGLILYVAKETTTCCSQTFCGSLRPFELVLKDDEDREVIHLSRPMACKSCLCPCLLQTMDIYSPPGQLAGRVVQDWGFTPKFRILDSTGATVFGIEGPFCTMSICGNIEFQILNDDRPARVVGKISGKWNGLPKEAFKGLENIGMSFPADLHVRMKAVLLGALFLIDSMYYNHSQ